VKIGISSLEYAGLPLEEVLKKANRFGVEHVELGIQEYGITISGMASTNALLKKYGIKVSGLSTDDATGLEAKLEMSRAVGADYLVIGPAFNIETNESRKMSLDAFRARLEKCLKVAEKERVILGIENHLLGIFRTAKGLAGILDSVDSPFLKLVYDPDNFYNAGQEGFPHALQLLRKHVAYVHVKDSMTYEAALHGNDVRVLHRAGIDAVCVPVGRGAVNWEGIIQSLREDGYDGFMILEPHMRPNQMDQAFIDGIAYLKGKLA
jgi:sugar phosphate isomerase/epimerase